MKNRSFQMVLLLAAGMMITACSVSRQDTVRKAPVETRNANIVVRDQSMDMGNVSLVDMLARVPGVFIGAGNSIQIRGAASINMDTEPLFVVDGSPVGIGYRSVAGLNPNIVDHIQVLKDSDASIYGVRGANGVILIKTRK